MARKKPYSLDYKIYSDKDRTAAIQDILDNLDARPTDEDLEQMADYILFGKDEKYLSSRDRKEILQPKRRYDSWATKDEKNTSLDALLEDPNTAPEIEKKTSSDNDKGPRYKVYKPEIKRPKYDDDGNLIDIGDADIPGMVELWERIDTLQERYDMYKGKIPPNDFVKNHPLTEYQLYKFGHQLIDIRRHQYYLKDAYKPTLKFFNVAPPSRVEVDFDTNTSLWLRPEEWCARKRNPKPFDLPQPPLEEVKENEEGLLQWKISDNLLSYENPDHIRALLDNYVNLLKHSYDRPYSTTRCILFDLDNLINQSELTELEHYLLEQRVAHRNVLVIQKYLAEDDILLTEQQIRTIMANKIPRKIAATAERNRLEFDLQHGLIEGLECTKCHRTLPKHPFYFSRSRDKRTGYCSQCKECQKAGRDSRTLAKGETPTNRKMFFTQKNPKY